MRKLQSGLFGWTMILALLLPGSLAASTSGLVPDPGTNALPVYVPLDSWSFYDGTNWTSDKHYAPVSGTNLAWSYLGDGDSLVVDTNVPAWLQYNVFESDGTTNLTVDVGTVTFWFAPSWSGTNAGGTGSGGFGRLLEVGGYTPDSSLGWWSLYVDPAGANIYFSTQTNDASSNVTTYISAPISWTTNYFHFVAVTYSATNTALYLDGEFITNGAPMTVYPGADVLADGFYIGSDRTGLNQAHGLFNNVETFNTPLDADTIAEMFTADFGWYMLSPWNEVMFNLSPAPFAPSTSTTPDVVTGQGNLLLVNLPEDSVYGTNANQVWITSLVSSAASDGTMNVTFTIEGGQNGYFYDVFVGTSITSPLGKGNWSWQGQGQRRQQCSLTELPQGTVFITLGTPQDSDGDGLTDAYENLVSKTDPHNAASNLDGLLDGWEVLLGLSPQTANFTSPGQRANYGYTPADWLDGVSGVRSGTVTTDNEGNVQSVSQ